MLTQEQQKKHEEIVARRMAIFDKENHMVRRNIPDDSDEDYEAYDQYIKNIPQKKECWYHE